MNKTLNEWDLTITKILQWIKYLLYTTVYEFQASPRPHIPVFPPDFFLKVNLNAKGAKKLFKTLAP